MNVGIASDDSSTLEFLPPPRPPPLLTDTQIRELARHGSISLSLPPELSSLYASLSQTALSDFFLGCSLADKRGRYPSSHAGEIGYIAIPGEKEYVTFRSLRSPSSPASLYVEKSDQSALEDVLQRTWRETAKLLYRVLVDLTRPIDSHELWKPLIESAFDLPETFDESTTTFMRLFRYLPTSGNAERHTDSGLLTLCVGVGQGLQVLGPPSDPTSNDKGIDDTQKEISSWSWHDAQGPTLLIGDTLSRLLGGRVRPGVHRVVGNPEGRSSAVFALRPNLDQEIDLGGDGDEGGTLKIRDLWTDISGRKWSVNAPKKVRDEQQQRWREQQQQLQEERGEGIALDKGKGKA